MPSWVPFATRRRSEATGGDSVSVLADVHEMLTSGPWRRPLQPDVESDLRFVRVVHQLSPGISERPPAGFEIGGVVAVAAAVVVCDAFEDFELTRSHTQSKAAFGSALGLGD